MRPAVPYSRPDDGGSAACPARAPRRRRRQGNMLYLRKSFPHMSYIKTTAVEVVTP